MGWMPMPCSWASKAMRSKRRPVSMRSVAVSPGLVIISHPAPWRARSAHQIDPLSAVAFFEKRPGIGEMAEVPSFETLDFHAFRGQSIPVVCAHRHR